MRRLWLELLLLPKISRAKAWWVTQANGKNTLITEILYYFKAVKEIKITTP